jgi:hypothetical protein
MFHFILSILLLLTPVKSKTSDFEGKITFVRQSLYDTSYCSVYVKEEWVRVDEFDKARKLENSYLINTLNKSVTALSPSKKLYTNVQARSPQEPSDEKFVIIKTQNIKIINGYKCYQWRVKNKARSSEIAYWVADDHFNFFERFLKIFNITDNFSEFFLQIPETKGYFPILTVERTLVRDEKARIQVIDIIKTSLSSTLFKIPKGYRNIQN